MFACHFRIKHLSDFCALCLTPRPKVMIQRTFENRNPSILILEMLLTSQQQCESNNNRAIIHNLDRKIDCFLLQHHFFLDKRPRSSSQNEQRQHQKHCNDRDTARRRGRFHRSGRILEYRCQKEEGRKTRSRSSKRTRRIPEYRCQKEEGRKTRSRS